MQLIEFFTITVMTINTICQVLMALGIGIIAYYLSKNQKP